MKLTVHTSGEKYEFENANDAASAIKMSQTGVDDVEVSVHIEVNHYNDSLASVMKAVTDLRILGCVVNTEVTEDTMKERFGFRTVAEMRDAVRYFAEGLTVVMNVT